MVLLKFGGSKMSEVEGEEYLKEEDEDSESEDDDIEEYEL